MLPIRTICRWALLGRLFVAPFAFSLVTSACADEEPGIPGPPTDLQARREGGTVIITWKAPANPNLAFFELYRFNESLAEEKPKKIQTIPADLRTYSDDDLEVGYTYTYYMTALSKAGDVSDVSKYLHVMFPEEGSSYDDLP
jgi:pentatricopeptide repeat protein